MKILPVVKHLKKQAESVYCSDCDVTLTFKSVGYSDFILRNGGELTVDSICKGCGKDVSMIMKINPIREEFIE